MLEFCSLGSCVWLLLISVVLCGHRGNSQKCFTQGNNFHGLKDSGEANGFSVNERVGDKRI